MQEKYEKYEQVYGQLKGFGKMTVRLFNEVFGLVQLCQVAKLGQANKENVLNQGLSTQQKQEEKKEDKKEEKKEVKQEIMSYCQVSVRHTVTITRSYLGPVEIAEFVSNRQQNEIPVGMIQDYLNQMEKDGAKLAYAEAEISNNIPAFVPQLQG